MYTYSLALVSHRLIHSGAVQQRCGGVRSLPVRTLVHAWRTGALSCDHSRVDSRVIVRHAQGTYVRTCVREIVVIYVIQLIIHGAARMCYVI